MLAHARWPEWARARLRFVGDAPLHVILDAQSDWSGRVEPIAWTRSYGKGRVFVTVLGHDVESRKNPAFVRLVEQACSWAAAGSSD